jgi:hypothetical protein
MRLRQGVAVDLGQCRAFTVWRSDVSEVLKGNFVTKKMVETPKEAPETLEERFERTALKRLGGSIAFVSKKKVMWDLKDKI